MAFYVFSSSLDVVFTLLDRALNTLFDRVAPNAILNSGGRADDVRCHPGTRKEVIRLIDKWRSDIRDGLSANQIFWLSGPAGAGKTAIVQTVAESWKSLGIHIASFFFFRTDPSRSHAKAFLSTLLYQIFDCCPAARTVIDEILIQKPRILDMGLEEQFDELIFTAFRAIKSSLPPAIILLIDGLDECDSESKTSQWEILRVLDKLMGHKDILFLVLVASRAEPHISSAFRSLTSPMLSIFLGDQYAPEADIQLFVETEFNKIRMSHPHAAMLERDWPSESQVRAIVVKSSGQFIYAATVMRFISRSSTVPSLSLERVTGIFPLGKNSPFTHLDAVYTYILEQVQDQQAIRDILSSKLLDDKLSNVYSVPYRGTNRTHYLPPTNEFLQYYDARYTEALFTSCISDVTAIVRLQDARIVFYHASLTDFLLERSRSGHFYVDIKTFAAKVLPNIWKNGVMSEGHSIWGMSQI